MCVCVCVWRQARVRGEFIFRYKFSKYNICFRCISPELHAFRTESISLQVNKLLKFGNICDFRTFRELAFSIKITEGTPKIRIFQETLLVPVKSAADSDYWSSVDRQILISLSGKKFRIYLPSSENLSENQVIPFLLQNNPNLNTCSGTYMSQSDNS
jgi:hypothetical protein